MPGIATHYVFGTDAYRAAEQAIGDRPEGLAAFLLGNQGPDPFFYLAATPMERPIRRIGKTMHRQRTAALLQAMHDRLVASAEDPVLVAYALGFLCHFILDSTVHPLVYAQEHAICSIGIERLKGEWPHHVAHATIETSIDEYMLTTKLGTTAAAMPPHRTMLRCPPEALAVISGALADVISQVYETECPDSAFATAVGLFRTSQKVLDSKSSGLRRRLDLLPKGGAAMAYVRSLSHRPGALPHTSFTNDDHIAWPHAFVKGQVVSASFDELYAQSKSKAQETLPAFAQAAADDGLFEAIVGGVNFLGQPCDYGDSSARATAQPRKRAAGENEVKG